MKSSVCIFDIDGTLWNACSATAKGLNQALDKLKIPTQFTAQQIEEQCGHPSLHGLELLIPNVKLTPEILNALNHGEEELIKKEGGKFYEGAIEGIKELSKSYKIFLVSNCQDWYLEFFIEYSGLKQYLSGFNCHGMSGSPKSEMFREIITKHDLKSAVYIGDTQGDYSAAQEARIDFIHAAYGFGKIEKQDSKRYNSLNEIINYFKGL